MRFYQTVRKINDALSLATHALSARSTLPILECVYMQAENGVVTVRCTDGAMTISTDLEAQIDREGSVALPGKLLCEILRKLPDDEDALFEVNERNTLILKCGMSRSTVAGRAGNLFPEQPAVRADTCLRIPQPLLKDMIAQTSFAVAAEDSRKVLTGELIEVSKGELRVVALDGFRVAVRRAPIGNDAPDLNCVVPGKLLCEIAKFLSDDEESFANLSIGENQIMVEVGNTRAYASLLEEEFIDYRRILPDTFLSRMTLPRERLAACMERASLFARESKTNLVKMNVTRDTLVITSNSENGDIYEEQAVELEGDELEIAFNVKYLSDTLRAIEDETIVMCFNTSLRPCVVLPTEGSGYAYMILPLRLNAN